MKYNASICGTPQRTGKDNLQAVRVLITFKGQKKYVPTGVRWESGYISKDGIGRGSKPFTSHTEAVNIINKVLQKIENIFTTNTFESIEDFLRLYNDSTGGKCFIQYWGSKMYERYRLNQISYKTYRDQNASLNKLKEVRTILPFNEIDLRFIDTYKAWLQGQGLKRNTVWGRIKDFRTYLNLAIKDKYTENYPFKDFKMPKPQARISFLTEEEFLMLRTYFEETENLHHREALRPFLFSCYTGLRVSDIQNIRRKNFKTQHLLIYEPFKSRRSETKRFLEVECPIHPYARSLVKFPDKSEVLIFRDIVSEQKLNDHYKKIAQNLGIQPFSFHYSRHTFATRFLRFGGKIEVLQKILGHEDIKTTLIYVHIEPSHADNQINLLT